MTEEYQILLKETKAFLQYFQNELQLKILNLMMAGEMSAWDKEAEINDEIILDNSFFEASDDENVMLLWQLVKQTRKIISQLS